MNERRRLQAGFTMLESLLVLLVLGMTVIIAVSVVAERMRLARIRVIADQYAMDVRAARLKAVSLRSPIDLVVTTSGYSYTIPGGKTRQVEMPAGVTISSSTSPIRFEPNGAVPGGATTAFQIDLSASEVARWTIDISVLGVPDATFERV